MRNGMPTTDKDVDLMKLRSDEHDAVNSIIKESREKLNEHRQACLLSYMVGVMSTRFTKADVELIRAQLDYLIEIEKQ